MRTININKYKINFIKITKLFFIILMMAIALISPLFMQGCSSNQINPHQYENNKTLTTFTISKNIKTICSYAFAYSSVKEIIFEENSCLEVIESYAFDGCINLEKITFPKSLKRIESSAFQNCNKLSEINFNEGLEYIGSRAFNMCAVTSNKKLNIKLPNSLINTGGHVFQNSKIGNIILGKNMKKIESYDFYNTGFDNITIYSSTTEIKDGSLDCDLPLATTGYYNIYLPDKKYNLYFTGYKFKYNRLKNIYYSGSEQDWQNYVSTNLLEINLDNDSIQIHYNY